jgi:hypothetical protein
MLYKILPVIRTCAADPHQFEVFVDSYMWRVDTYLSPPLVSIDLTKSCSLPRSYLRQLGRLDPIEVTLHSRSNEDDYLSIQDGAWWAIKEGLRYTQEFEYIMFVEDDVEFSSNFIDAIKNANFDPKIGHYSFYTPYGGFGVAKLDRSQVFGGYIFGSQCLLFPMVSIKLLVDNEQIIRKTYPYGCDLQWARFLFDQEREIWTSTKSYVQHMQSKSRMNNNNHQSYCYVP